MSKLSFENGWMDGEEDVSHGIQVMLELISIHSIKPGLIGDVVRISRNVLNTRPVSDVGPDGTQCDATEIHHGA